MKKIRILAAVLAVLMLPLATLFACNKEPDWVFEQNPDLIIKPGDEPAGPTVTVDNDGSKDGYLLFYNFNEHELGNLKESEPYSDYIAPAEKDGCSYVVKAKKGSENDNVLLITSPDGNTLDPYLSVFVKNAADLNPQHMLEFDIRWEKGLFLGTASVLGRKEGPTTTSFLKITNDGIGDDSGAIYYGDDAADVEGWVNVQIVIDDINRVYDLYINGVKKLSAAPYANTAYKGWDEEKAAEYRITVDSNKSPETLLYIDNVGVKNCVSSEVDYTATDITYKDSYQEYIPFINMDKAGVLRYIELGKFGTDAPMNEHITLSAFVENGEGTADDEFVDILFDHKYETGATTETTTPTGVAPEGAELVMKYTNFNTTGSKYFAPDGVVWDPDLYDTFRFTFYATEKMVKDKYRFMILFDCGRDAANVWSYYPIHFYVGAKDSANTKPFVEGWNTYEFSVSGITKNNHPTFAEIYQLGFVFSGWSNGVDKVVQDGYTIYVKEFGFVSPRSVITAGPSKENENCLHADADGNTYFKDVEEPIAATCTAGSYYVEKCSACGATRVDDDKEKTLAKGHTYDGDVMTVNPTCGTAGYTYQDCSICGFRKITSTINTLVHSLTVEYDWNLMKKYEICKICGTKNESSIVLEMIGIEEKIALLEESLGTTDFPYYYCDEDTNNTVNYDGTNSGSMGSGQQRNYMVNMKYCQWQALEHPISGDMAFMHKKTSETQASDSYNDLRFTDRFAKGTNMVAEFKVMLGSKGADGKYAALNISWMDRNSGAGNLPTLFQITTDGKFKNMITSKLYDLYDNKFIHVAFSYHPATGDADLYIDGKLVEEYSTGSAKPTFLANDMRFTWATKNVTEHGASHYFNDFLGYPATAPICVLPDGESIIENVGDITVNGVATNFNVANSAVKGTFNVGTFTSKYVIAMDLAASGSLKDGALLNAVKVVEGFEEKLALLEVKGGKLYSMGVLVANSANGKIEVVCNDQHDTISVYVDGTLVLDNYNYTAGVYADSDEYINGIVFEAIGNYAVSNFAFYTGTAPKVIAK